MIFNLKIILLSFLFINFHVYQCLNSYIYLPDKLINEEISIGSQIIDLVDELNLYFEKFTSLSVNNNGDGLSKSEKKSVLELKSQLRNQQYTFLEDIKQQTSDQTYFLIDLITGRITTKRYLDRESMCLNRHCLETCDAIMANNNNMTNNQRGNNCKMNLKILLIPSYNIVSMNIIIQDINDNKPYFTNNILNQVVPENVPVGHRIPLDLAYDADTGINSVQHYKLINLENKTFIEPQQDVFDLIQNLNELQLALVVRKKLDREIKSMYFYKLIASDGGRPVPFTGEQEIFISISDINDNNPKFQKELYSFTIPEDTPMGTQIGKIEATDLDEGLNGLVKYKIVNINNNDNIVSSSAVLSDNNNYKYFALNETTGILTLNSELDYEVEQFYSLTIEAKDCGAGSLPAYAQVEIYVSDSNDNSPEISVSFLNTLFKNYSISDQKLNIYVSESINPNKYLAHVSIFDKDSLDNGKIDWKVFVNDKEVTNTKKPQLIQINKLNANSFTINTGNLIKNSTVLYDREQLSSFEITILASDFGKPIPKSTYYNITVNLIDENDNAPKFQKSQFNFIIYENNPINYLIGCINASDADIEENGRIAYKIKETEYESYFSIDSKTGMLSAIKSLDREEKSIYRFQVAASDNGKPPLTSTTFVRIDLVDINDNEPKILFNTSYLSKEQLPTKNTVVIKLDEDMPLDSMIIKFYANDPDDGDNGKAKFLIKKLIKVDSEEQQSQTLPFRLYPNGDFKLVSKLDREKTDKFEMIVQCQDQAAATIKGKSLSSEVHLIIYIRDVNDNCPQGIINPLEVNDTRTKFINKEQLLNSRVISSIPNLDKYFSLFETNYTDGDLGLNSELKFDLVTYQDLFLIKEIPIRVRPNQIIYRIQLRLKVTNTTDSNNKISITSFLKLGKYVIKLRISDKGEPSCSNIDNYILFVGDNQYKTLNEITEEIKNQLKQEPLNTFNLDEENDFIDMTVTNNSKISLNMKQNHKLIEKSKNEKHQLQEKIKKYTQNDYLLLIAVTSIVIIVLIFFTLLCTIYFYNRYNKNPKAKVIENDKLLQNNGVESNSKALILGPTGFLNQQGSNSNSEILYNADNRLSLSFKSTEDTDQSNSIDSITSSTLTKETKASSTQINSDLINQHQPKTVTYSTTTTFQRCDKPKTNTIGRNPIKTNIHDPNNSNTIKYSSINGYTLTKNNYNTSDNLYKTPNNNYKSILKDSKSKRLDNNNLKRPSNNVNSYNSSQTSSDIIDINDLDEESTSFLTSRIQLNYNNSNQYDFKSSAV